MFIIAMLATWRLTEILTVDRISEPLRKVMPWYIWKCPRCVSVWAGIACTAAYLKYPLLNVPLAVSETYILLQSVAIIVNATMLSKPAPVQPAAASVPAETNHGRHLHVASDNKGALTLLRSDFSSDEATNIFLQLIPAMKAAEKERAQPPQMASIEK